MLLTVWNVARRVWRGAWKPTYSLRRERRWWHYIDYWGWRSQDIVGALYIFIAPLWIGFFIYEKYSTNPKATVALMAFMSSLWLVLVVLAYYKGRSQND